jgi:hypothetical protein
MMDAEGTGTSGAFGRVRVGSRVVRPPMVSRHAMGLPGSLRLKNHRSASRSRMYISFGIISEAYQRIYPFFSVSFEVSLGRLSFHPSHNTFMKWI